MVVLQLHSISSAYVDVPTDIRVTSWNNFLTITVSMMGLLSGQVDKGADCLPPSRTVHSSPRHLAVSQRHQGALRSVSWCPPNLGRGASQMASHGDFSPVRCCPERKEGEGVRMGEEGGKSVYSHVCNDEASNLYKMNPEFMFRTYLDEEV